MGKLVRLALGVVVFAVMLTPGATSATESPVYEEYRCEADDVLCSPISTLDYLPVTLEKQARPATTTAHQAYRKFCRVLWITWRVECP